MFKKIIFTVCLISSLFVAHSALAQDVDKQLQSIGAYNSNVNENLSTGKLYVHRLTLNSPNSDAHSKIWGGLSKYQENANFYFELRDGLPILKKVIIVSEITNRQAYTDFLYDEQGVAMLCMYQHDIAKTTESASRYYYNNKRLIQVSRGTLEDTKYLKEAEFVTQDVQSGIEMLARAESFKKIFDAIVRVQAPTVK
jgi:hypothetical protein